jgi:hypothetical protein
MSPMDAHFVLKPMEIYDMEERDEIPLDIREKPFTFDYQAHMNIEDNTLLSMMYERDELD